MQDSSMFEIGDDLYVRSPQRFIKTCTCIVGEVVRISKTMPPIYTIRAYVGEVGVRHEPKLMGFKAVDLGRRLGTPISKISGRPGAPGYSEWLRISGSWGHP
jgi:hypothetical protein